MYIILANIDMRITAGAIVMTSNHVQGFGSLKPFTIIVVNTVFYTHMHTDTYACIYVSVHKHTHTHTFMALNRKIFVRILQFVRTL